MIPMILEIASDSLAALGMLGTAERIAAAAALMVGVSAIGALRRIESSVRTVEPGAEADDVRDAA
jgi:hypothetical protein